MTRTRFTRLIQIPVDITPKAIKKIKNVLQITWPDGHVSNYNLDWLKMNSYSPDLNPKKLKNKIYWDSDLLKNLPVTSYDQVILEKEALKRFLTNIDVYGIAFVDNTPPTLEATKLLAEQISFIRETHYG